jgi:hydroxymethylglutaryl-CoA lyase
MAIQIVEVGPRDGLQNEANALSVEDKVKLIRGAEAAGLQRIEIGAFVSPRWVPQMADSDKVAQQILQKPKQKVRYSALVPNERGMQEAISAGLKEVAIFGAASETFSKKNINCSIDESFQRFSAVIKIAKINKIKVRGYLSSFCLSL